MKKHILCFGDSNTHGFRAEDLGRFSEEERWTHLLQKKLGEDYLVIEEGLSGRTTSFEDPLQEGLSGVSYIMPCLLTHKPISLLVVMLGTNDTKERFGASPACIALGLKRLLQKAISTDCWESEPNILIVTPKNIEKEYENTFVASTMGKGCAEKSQQLAKEYETIAELLGCHFMDANDFVTAYNKLDFMHLTAEGHRELADALEKKIQEIFARESK